MDDDEKIVVEEKLIYEGDDEEMEVFFGVRGCIDYRPDYLQERGL